MTSDLSPAPLGPFPNEMQRDPSLESGSLEDLKNVSMALSVLEKSREWRWAVWLLEDIARRRMTPDLCLV